jgi:hypothetical protein
MPIKVHTRNTTLIIYQLHNPQTTALTPLHQPSTMSHETVYYSRPRTYGKGSRSWYATNFPSSCTPANANVSQHRQRREEEIGPHPQVRPQHESSGVQREGGGHGMGQGMLL